MNVNKHRSKDVDAQGLTLADVGEFALINDVILPTLAPVAVGSEQGDDCSFLTIPSPHIAVTCDVGPRPVAWSLGLRSYWSWGWHTVIINISDLATTGARPLAITTSLEAPASFLVEDIREFFDGIVAACKRFGLQTAGGNIRAAPRFEVHATALGALQDGGHIGRHGCRPGHYLFAIGEMGQLISALIKGSHCGLDALEGRERDALLRPTARTEEMQCLRHLVQAASDSSDGVLGALWNIAERSRCGIELHLDTSVVPETVVAAAQLEKVDPWNLMFFWGDWQIIVAVAETDMETFHHIARQEGIPVTELGRATASDPALRARILGQSRRVRLLRNENFRPGSFNAGTDEHITTMLHSSLFE
jgi:thiamine-monophosphate kinase